MDIDKRIMMREVMQTLWVCRRGHHLSMNLPPWLCRICCAYRKVDYCFEMIVLVGNLLHSYLLVELKFTLIVFADEVSLANPISPTTQPFRGESSATNENCCSDRELVC